MIGRISILAAATFAMLPGAAQAEDMTADELAAAEKACNKLTKKSRATPERLEACHLAGREYGIRDSAIAQRDGEKSALYLDRACTMGSGKSCSLISWYYLDNSAYRSSSEKSREYDAKGCDLDDAVACAGMGYWSKTDGDPEAAKAYYRKALKIKPDYESAAKSLAELEAQ